MSVTQSMQKRTVTAVPSELNSANAKLVYLFVDISAGASVDEMQSSLGLGKMALFSVLDSLSKQGFVEQRGREYVTA